MLFRPFIAAFMILVSLTAHARMEFACGMNAEAITAHDCCPPDGGVPCAAGLGQKACCDKVTVVSTDALLGHASMLSDVALADVFQPIDFPPTILPPDFELMPAAEESVGRYHPPLEFDAGRHRARPLYLQTARLRL